MIKPDALLGLPEESKRELIETVERSIDQLRLIMSDQSATATNKLKCIEMRFELEEAKIRLRGGAASTDEIVELKRAVAALYNALRQFDEDLANRCVRGIQ